jgi:protein TonB
MLSPALNPLAFTAATLSLGAHAIVVGVLLLEPAEMPTERVQIVPVVQAARASASANAPTGTPGDVPQVAAAPVETPSTYVPESPANARITLRSKPAGPPLPALSIVTTDKPAPTLGVAPRVKPAAQTRERSPDTLTTETASLTHTPSELQSVRAIPRIETLIAVKPGNAQPRYPLAARKRGDEGEAIVRVEVSGAGQVNAAEVVKSSGFDILDNAAREAVARWQFQPATRDGRPTAGRIDVPIEFRLR